MLDGKLVFEHREEIEGKLRTKDEEVDLSLFISAWTRKRALLPKIEGLRATRSKKSSEKLDESSRDEVAQMRASILSLEEELRECEAIIRDELGKIPNIPADDVPVGDLSKVKIVKASNLDQIKKGPLDHTEVAKKYNLIDFDRGVKISGSKWHFYVGKGAILERALINFFIDSHIKFGMELLMPPLFVNEEAMFGSGNLPKFREQLYFSEKDRLFAIPTAEVPLVGFHADEILPKESLPMFYCAYTPCFRREIGARASEKGLIRTHQFNKVEMVAVCTPEHSERCLQQLVEHANSLLDLLGLPYRNALLPTTDISFCASKTIDVEVFVPSQDRFYEVSSVSNCTDFQSRRLCIRYKDKEKGKNSLVHLLNGSGLATSRLMVAILESCQDDDGAIIIPEVLRPYTGFDKIC